MSIVRGLTLCACTASEEEKKAMVQQIKHSTRAVRRLMNEINERREK